jgi:hypothetical protein
MDIQPCSARQTITGIGSMMADHHHHYCFDDQRLCCDDGWFDRCGNQWHCHVDTLPEIGCLNPAIMAGLQFGGVDACQPEQNDIGFCRLRSRT